MKKTLSVLALLVVTYTSFAQDKIKDGTKPGTSNLPVAGAVLELESASKGFLPTRVSLADRLTYSPVTGPSTNGMIVYNTNGAGLNGLDTGLVIWQTDRWNPLGQKIRIGVVDFTDCGTIEVIGAYYPDKALNQQTVSVRVPVRVTTIGDYSDTLTVNGITFLAEGTYTQLGPTTIFFYPVYGSPANTASGVYAGNLKIAPTYADGATGKTCSVSIRFLRRSDATLKIINISGTNGYATGLITGCDYSSSTSAAKLGAWLSPGTTTAGPGGGTIATARSIAGVANITIQCVDPTAIASLKTALAGASIVYLNGRSTSQWNEGTVAVLKEWYDAGKGIIIDQGDELNETKFMQGLGYFVESGLNEDGSTRAENLSQVFQTPSGYTLPYTISTSPRLIVDNQGSNSAYVTGNRGSAIIYGITSNQVLGFADIGPNTGAFLFGDKFFHEDTTPNKQFFTDMFAWAIHNCPVYQ